MTSPATRARRVQAPLVPRVKVWIELGGRYAFGLGISDILQAVGRAGSIKQAAADLGKSYRHVWGRIKEAEECLGRPLVEARVGGRGARRMVRPCYLTGLPPPRRSPCPADALSPSSSCWW